MANTKKELVKKLLKNNNVEGNEEELLEMLIDEQVALDPDKETLTKGEKVADKFTKPSFKLRMYSIYFRYIKNTITMKS